MACFLLRRPGLSSSFVPRNERLRSLTSLRRGDGASRGKTNPSGSLIIRSLIIMITRRFTATLLATIPLVGALALVERGNPVRAAGPQGSPQQLIVISAEGPSVSPAMRDLPTLTTAVVPSEVHPALRLPRTGNDDPPTEDPVRQTEARQPEVAPTVLLNFEGISFATGGTGAPPDTNGAAGL